MRNRDFNGIKLALAGDVMVGRGVDQLFEQSNSPELRERYVDDARIYVDLARRAHGSVPAAVSRSYVWGEALDILERERPDAAVVNLETSVTTSDEFWPGKGIHYRMHPDNIGCLTAAGIDVCSLANNHVLDFGRKGLLETLEALEAAGIEAAGAGETLAAARRPARVELKRDADLAVFSFGLPSSGIPAEWAATENRPGIHLLEGLTGQTLEEVLHGIDSSTGSKDVVVASTHWGSNWGFDISESQVAFARGLIEGGVDIVHGHSSHHVRPIEIHRRRPIFYGCGDLITDYEGIGGYEKWRGDLGAMYFLALETGTGEMADLRMVPTTMERMRLARPSDGDVRWLRDKLTEISQPFGVRFQRLQDGSIEVIDEGSTR